MPVNEQFVISLKGKQFVLLAGLLDLAHQQGLRSIETEVMAELCIPEEKRFVVRAIGRFRTGEGEDAIWSAHGDSDPTNSQMRGAELRHAETRAIARMLRFATNVAMTAFEELGPDAEHQNGHQEAHAARTGPPQRAKHDPTDHAEKTACAVCGAAVPAAVANAAVKEFAETLCIPHARERRARRAETEVAA